MFLSTDANIAQDYFILILSFLVTALPFLFAFVDVSTKLAFDKSAVFCISVFMVEASDLEWKLS